MTLEILAVIFGLTQGLLIMYNKRSNWIFYILQITMMLLFSMLNHLYGDMTNNLIYLAMGIYGALLWGKNQDTSRITSCGNAQRIGYTTFMIATAICLSCILHHTNDPLPMLDAFTTVSGFVATWLMVRRKIDTWILWTINDIIYVIEYAVLPEPAYWLMGLNMVWTVMAILSYIKWKKIMIAGAK